MQEMFLKRNVEEEIAVIEEDGLVGPDPMAKGSTLEDITNGGGGGRGQPEKKKMVMNGEEEEEEEEDNSSSIVEEAHPYDFQVCGPRNLSSPNWREIIKSSWKDPKYKRMVVACFVQSVYLLELDRQDKRTEDNSLAPKWWKPFKYKLTQTLIDERDGSIYGAILEWDRYAALADYIVMRPSGAPRAILVLRGTLLKSPTIRRDLQDDLRFLAWESLKGSVRFDGALEALKSAVQRFGSGNVCVGGHSLGAGFALQVGKALAKEGVFVECHLFNPPSVSLAMSLKNIGESAGFLWRRIRTALPSKSTVEKGCEEDGGKRRKCAEIKKWMPHLYVNSSDYICSYYTDPAAIAAESKDVSLAGAASEAAAKLFVMSKGQQKFLEAHGLEQWWSDDVELSQALHNSKLINRQLKSLYDVVQPTPPKKQ